MKRMDYKEFAERTADVARARRIFGKLTEGNITEAFALYQEVLAEDDERKALVITSREANRPLTPFDQYERPVCPDCGFEMHFRNVLENDEGIKTQLVCANVNCDTVLNSEMDITEWMGKLKRVDGNVE